MKIINILITRVSIVFFLFVISIFINTNQVFAANNFVSNGKYKIENSKGEVLQDENDYIKWSKWSAKSSQIWNVEYQKPNWQGVGGYTLTSDRNPGKYIFWNRGSGNGKGVLLGRAQDAPYTRFWNFNKIDGSDACSISNFHFPSPYVSNDVSSVTTDGSLSGSFIFNSDLTLPENKTNSLIFTSDPQYPWTDKSDTGEPEDDDVKKRRSQELIEEQYNDINLYTDSTNNQSNIMINGDITAFGHDWQWDKMSNLMTLLNSPYYMGLGNHDIENNQGDCFQDSCFARSIKKLNAFRNKANIKRHDISFGRSSQNYSIELPGNMFALQLNNEPTMDYKSPWTDAGVQPNLDWIENELKYARNKGYNIIVNVHKPDDWKYGPNERFKNMMKEYDVKAIFAGHYHNIVGKFSSKNYFGDVPVYLSGGSSRRTYLISEYNDKKMDIYIVRQNDWRSTKKLDSTISLE